MRTIFRDLKEIAYCLRVLIIGKPYRIKFTYKERTLSNQNVTLPLGPNSVTLQAFDANGNDITATCKFTLNASDSSTIQIGLPTAANVFPIDVLQVPTTPVELTGTCTNSSGNVSETDTITIQSVVAAPASMKMTYETVVGG